MSFKVCTKCKINKPIEEFYKIQTKTKYMSSCKVCKRLYVQNWVNINRPKTKEYKTTYRIKNRENARLKAKVTHLKNSYNITPDQLQELKNKQNNKCLLCSKETKLYVDHCHKSGKIRGLLCPKCNSALGLFFDNTDVLEKAIKYLKDNNENGS